MEQLRIDLVPGGVTPNAHASQYDIGRVIRFNLYNGGSAYTLAGTETITVEMTKPDETTATVSVTNTSSTYVDFVTTSGLLDLTGLYPCEIKITNGGDVIGSQNFNLRAEADAFGNGLVVILEAQGNPAHFETGLAGALVDASLAIPYRANGYTSATIVNASSTPTVDKVPYQYRQTPITANRCLEKLVGCSVAFNQLFNFTGSTTTINGITFTVNADNGITLSGTASDMASLSINTGTSIINGHKYFISGGYDNNIRITNTMTSALTLNASASIKACDYTTNYADFSLTVSNGTAISTPITVYPMFIDLTAMFGSEVADYLYTLEQNTAGSGISLFRQLFPEDYYAYQTATLMSAKPTSKVIKDSNDQTIATYPLGGDELRGLLKVVDGKLVAYGDVKGSDGIIYRNFEERAYASGDESLPNAITDGTNTVVKLTTPTTASGTPFTNPMLCGSTEEFTDTRTIKMPCGHDTIYGNDLTYATADFGTTVYGGSIDFTTGTLISNKNADGTDKTAETISVTPAWLGVRNGSNYVMGDTTGNSTVKYYKKA